MAWNSQSSHMKSFRFEAKWCLDDSFEGMVRRWWEEESDGVLNKLKKMGHQMLKWSKATSSKEKRNRISELEDGAGRRTTSSEDLYRLLQTISVSFSLLQK
ncbi:hypothetical protein GOBAR_DD16305 [Gossypium barbadense]|nr:hypothetical protein GOBAR_DD16305 [Gossypium barbadense]